MRRSDQALNAAKESGRNQAYLYDARDSSGKLRSHIGNDCATFV